MWSIRGKPENLAVMSLKNTNPMVPRIGSRSTLSCEHLVHHYRRMVPQILDTLEFRSNKYPPSGDFSSRVAQKYQGSTQHTTHLTTKFSSTVSSKVVMT